MKQKCADELSENENAATGGDPDLTPEQYQQSLQEDLDDARASGDTEEAKRLEGELEDAQHAHCRAEMGRRLTGQPGAGPPHVDGRCPAGSRPKARGNETGPGLIDPAEYVIPTPT